jgi:hypothetical protein
MQPYLILSLSTLETHLWEAVETYGEDFADEPRFQVPKGCPL